MIKGVLLDVDGTLVLSNEAHTGSWIDALAEAGFTVSHDKVRGLVGMGGDQLLPRVVEGLDSETEPGKHIAQRRSEILKERYMGDIEAAPGARELAQRIQHAGLKLMVASSASKDELGYLLRIAHVEELIHEATTKDDAPSSKPAPDIVDAALKKIALPVADVVMIGDTPYDIESAGKANVGVIALRCGGFSDDTFKGALAIYDDPQDLAEHFDQSPLGKK